MQASEARQRLVFPLIDVVRGFAALSVLVYHLIPHWEWDAFPSTGPLAWFRSGWMAVDIFFVISGFVIGLSAFGRLETHPGEFRGGFLRNRLARIVPLHYLMLAVFVLAIEPAVWQQEDFWANLGTHLLFLHNLFLPYAGAINGPNWSVATEMQFYLLIAFAAPWLARVSPWRLLVLFVALAWAWRWWVYLALGAPGPLDHAYLAQTQLPGMLDEFALGLLLARFVRTSAGQAVLARLGADARIRWALVVLTGLGWWALFGVYYANDYWQVAAMAVFFRTALACCAGATLLLACGWPVPKNRALVAVPLYLGKVSYGIYLWHLPVLLFLGQHTELAPAVALPLAIAATVGLAALTWHLFEQPLLRRCSGPAGGTSRTEALPLDQCRAASTAG
jgi:peptidoglycan/LPS O-acetylase OafA/YrhL